MMFNFVDEYYDFIDGSVLNDRYEDLDLIWYNQEDRAFRNYPFEPFESFSNFGFDVACMVMKPIVICVLILELILSAIFNLFAAIVLMIMFNPEDSIEIAMESAQCLGAAGIAVLVLCVEIIAQPLSLLTRLAATVGTGVYQAGTAFLGLFGSPKQPQSCDNNNPQSTANNVQKI